MTPKLILFSPVGLKSQTHSNRCKRSVESQSDESNENTDRQKRFKDFHRGRLPDQFGPQNLIF